jgi:cysteine desulfurase
LKPFPVYLDHAATTPILPVASEAVASALAAGPGNPSSAHSAGRKARQLLEDARDRVAALLGARADEVVFTSGATEANNLAVFGLVSREATPSASASDALGVASRLTCLSSAIEHPCVVEPLRQLGDVTWLPVSPHGTVEPQTVLEHVTDDTRFVSLMLANHETGAIQPVREVAHALPKHVLTHTDAAQAVGKMPVHFRDLGVTALTASAHKFGGPVGVGLLLLKGGAKLRPQMFGGHQQRGHRPGTEPVALAVGLTAALEHAVANMPANTDTVLSLRAALLARLAASLPLTLNPSPAGGEGNPILPHILNLSFPGCRSEVLLMALDLAGVQCSTGSACSSGSLLPSPVLAAMGVPDDVLGSAMRFSFSPAQTVSEVEWAADRVAECVRRVRG